MLILLFTEKKAKERYIPIFFLYTMPQIDALTEVLGSREKRALGVSPALWVSSTRDCPFNILLCWILRSMLEAKYITLRISSVQQKPRI